MKLAIFTHVLHQTNAREYSAYAPYIREMNLWLKPVDEVEVVAPLTMAIGTKGENSTMGLPYRHSNLTFTKVPSFALLNFRSSIKAVFKIPLIIFKIAGAIKRADHLHLRCPGNIGLLACICQIFFPLKPKTAKYAGNWDPEAKQPWSYNLQKWILSNTFLTRNMKVLAYGNWPHQSKNILSFFTASFNESEKEVIIKDFNLPYKFVYVGNLVPGKKPEVAIQIVEELNKRNIPAELHVHGDGELMNSLQNYAKNKAYIHLHGNQSLEVLKQAYKDAHFLILASHSEGWPKAVAEGMFFGCIPIATHVSCVPQMLNNGSRGILTPPAPEGGASKNEWVEEIVKKIEELLIEPEEMKRMSIEAQEWSQKYTLEKFEGAISELLYNKSSCPFGRGRGEG